MYCKIFFLIIMNIFYMSFILVVLSLKTSTEWFLVVTLLRVVPCTVALAAAILNLFRCKSRFCPSCGNRYNQQRALNMSFKLVSCTHRHCVFTIPEELRIFFLKIVLCSTYSFTLFVTLSCTCFSK